MDLLRGLNGVRLRPAGRVRRHVLTQPARVAWGLGIASLLIQVPFLNRGVSLLDEGSILAIADALRQGETLYADRVTPLAPLTYELMGFLLELFGPHLLVGRILQALVLMGCVLLVHAILRHFVSPRAALLGALAVLVLKPLGFPLWTIVNYSQIAMLFCLMSVLMALSFLPERRLSWLLGAGLGVGLTLITKQNLGVLLGGTIALAVGLDWLYDLNRSLRQLIVRSVALLGGLLPAVLAVIGLCAARGTLGDLIDRAILGPLSLPAPYWVPPPPLDLWSLRSGGLFELAFAYFPSPLLQLVLQGDLKLSSRALLVLIELSVKTAYYVPVLVLLLGLSTVAKGFLSRMSRAAWSQLLLILAFSGMAYSSMLYRADWTHLINIYPALIVLCVVVLAHWSQRLGWVRGIALALGGVWIAWGLMLAGIIFAVYDTPVDTPRGRISSAPSKATEVAQVLAYLDGQPVDERILFLRAEPLYYFLAGRRIPLPFDLLLPGLLAPGDDERVARGLGTIDQVLFNPKPIPTVPSPITEYAAKTATELAQRFRVEQTVGETAVVLKPDPALGRPESTVVDLWDRFDELRTGFVMGDGFAIQPAQRPDRLQRGSWLAYRVIATRIDTINIRRCFVLTHTVGAGESVSVLPLHHPAAWSVSGKAPASSAVRFEISIGGTSLYSAVHPPTMPGERVSVPLDSLVGKRIELRFCTALAPAALEGPAHARSGWAEPRIVRTGGP